MDRSRAISDFILGIAQPPRREIDAMIAQGKPLKLGKGESFCRIGEFPHRLGFIHSGLVRYHVITETGDDVTKDFTPAGVFTVSYGSAVRRMPAAVAISAVEPTELTVWPYELIHTQLSQGLEWERFGRRVAEMLYVRKEKREIDFLLRSATERYAAAVEEFGPSVARIPRDQLASYLGIAPESLSRLKKALFESRRKTAQKNAQKLSSRSLR